MNIKKLSARFYESNGLLRLSKHMIERLENPKRVRVLYQDLLPDSVSIILEAAPANELTGMLISGHYVSLRGPLRMLNCVVDEVENVYIEDHKIFIFLRKGVKNDQI